ncbi:MAG: NADH-quinone oxidoreductase subunit M, partial [Rhodococcus sp.]|nr:NADH-quinone oxidoreductase subunit M [Rhodococcus sp. (in: high G+C Gram-positive bacteria)]
MTDFPWLTIAWLLPVAAAGIVMAIPAGRPQLARMIALAASLATLVIAVVLSIGFDPSGAQYQFVESHAWIPAFGTRYAVGIDGIALTLIVLTAVLVPLLLLAAWNDVLDADLSSRRPHAYMALFLLLEAMVIVSFSALDILLFYILFEAMLVPMYFLIGSFGGAGRSAAAMKFLLYNLVGGLVMLAAVIGLYAVTASADSPFESGTFDFRQIADAVASGSLDINSGLAKALFFGFMFAFAVKAPLWPLHTWLPGAATAGTPSTAVLMMAIVDKVGTFAMLRYALQLFPDAAATFTPVIITLAVISIIYGALVAIAQTDVLRLIAYTSISHFGFIILGIFAMTPQSQAGAALYMVNHGLSTAALFLVAGFLVSRRGTR